MCQSWCLSDCRNPVKFWFIKNYMSPQMKRFVPEMAAHYKFHYLFVTYKWPSFLHKQVTLTEMHCHPGLGFSRFVMRPVPDKVYGTAANLYK